MIGVLVSAAEGPIVREFFNLFKTPWEFCQSGASYDVLICSDGRQINNRAQLIIVYGSGPRAVERETGVREQSRRHGAILSWRGNRIPTYCESAILDGPGEEILLTDDGKVAGIECSLPERAVVRLGFDLFGEVRHLLGRGQPSLYAEIPTLELHIAMLREVIVRHGIRLCEIPPMPAGYKFIVCLTHDVDHPSIRNHRLDHTMFGFLYRSILGSIFQFCVRRRSFRQLLANWKAAISLPFVHLGWARDFWKTFERYGEMESGLPSTFFLIPRPNDPGQRSGARAPWKRAARYDPRELATEIDALMAAGKEVALHGIDAWRDSASGIAERDALRRLTDQSEVGVRMHWLYFDPQSPKRLEEAGFSYDSTVGFNNAVGFRAGTLQAFQPPGATRMLELPMHIMDTALFFSTHLNLSGSDADAVLARMVEMAVQFGGALVINWHDRSIAPERLWDQPYARLLETLKNEGAWFATCGEASAWFRSRRSAVVEQPDGEHVRVALDQAGNQHPGLRLRFHNTRPVRSGPPGPAADAEFFEVALSNESETLIPWPVSDELARTP